jgi:uncharacterized protein (TIGR00369 family)
MSQASSPSTPDLLAWGRKVLGQQAFSALLGTELDVFENGRAQLSLPMTPKLLQQNGFVHGGVLSYLADNALTYAGGSVLGPVLTSEFKINYLRPATDCDRLVAIASVVGSGKTQAVCRCDVFIEKAGERKLCAAAQGTIRKAE